MTTDRQRLLEYAGQLIHGDRNESYDEPAANFARIAALWSAYLGVELAPHDVAVLNVLQKVARLMHTPGHYDSWVDIAGYAACGYESWLRGNGTAEGAAAGAGDVNDVRIADRAVGDKLCSVCNRLIPMSERRWMHRYGDNHWCESCIPVRSVTSHGHA